MICYALEGRVGDLTFLIFRTENERWKLEIPSIGGRVVEITEKGGEE